MMANANGRLATYPLSLTRHALVSVRDLTYQLWP